MAASNQNELIRMINTTVLINDRPSAFRYPRGTGEIDLNDKNIDPIEIGKGIILYEGNDVAILNLGSRLQSCQEAIKFLNNYNIYPTLADARFAKPIDTDLLDKLLDNHKYLLTIEEGSSGGFGSSVLNYIHNKRIKTTSAKVNNIFFPDRFIDHQSPEDQYAEIGMDTNSIVRKIKQIYEDNVIDFQSYNKNIKN
jgi:1-deoxy-D-xylulose-5-phosphate synthase